jgi:cyclohexanone monooxygenase
MQEHWEKGPTAYAGVACAGFPNMFLVPGPQGLFSNYPPRVETEAGLVMECILHSERTLGAHVMEVSSEAERHWDSLCHKLTEGSLSQAYRRLFVGVNNELALRCQCRPCRRPQDNY